MPNLRNFFILSLVLLTASCESVIKQFTFDDFDNPENAYSGSILTNTKIKVNQAGDND